MKRVRGKEWDILVSEVAGPMGSVRTCRACGHFEFIKKGSGGFKEGNKARGRMIQHLKVAHPAKYSAALSTDCVVAK